MLSRAEFDSFLKLYGIPTSDDKYNQYKKSQTSSLVNKQYNELAGQIKRKLVKPKYPNIIVGPGTEAGNKANMDKYHKNLDAYNKQQELLKRNKDLITKLEKTHQKSVSKPKSSIQYDPNVTQETQHMLDKVNQSLNNPTKDEEYEKQQYQKFQQQQRDKASGKIPKSTPDIRAPKITPHGIVKPKIIKPNKIPNTNQHINHNIMSFQEYKNFQFNQGFGVGQVEYKRYLTQFNLNDPTPYLHSQISAENNKQGVSSLAKGQSNKDYSKQHSKNIIQHLQNTKTVAPGTINKVNPPVAIKLHNFQNPIPAAHEHHVDAHSINKEAGTMVGNPVFANSKPKVVSGPREDNHLNPTPQPKATPTQPPKISFAPHKETFAEFRARTANQQAKPAPQPGETKVSPSLVGQDAGDMIF